MNSEPLAAHTQCEIPAESWPKFFIFLPVAPKGIENQSPERARRVFPLPEQHCAKEVVTYWSDKSSRSCSSPFVVTTAKEMNHGTRTLASVVPHDPGGRQGLPP